MNNHENRHNGCKPKNVSVFASVSRFGETKFKPIRKQENISVVKSLTPNKKQKIETDNVSPVKRVNKFFKSRNATVLEDTNKNKPIEPRKYQSTELKSIPTNITPIKNESKFKEDKPIKLKIKKESVDKTTKQIKQKVNSNFNTDRKTRSTRNSKVVNNTNNVLIEENKPDDSLQQDKMIKRYATRYTRSKTNDIQIENQEEKNNLKNLNGLKINNEDKNLLLDDSKQDKHLIDYENKLEENYDENNYDIIQKSPEKINQIENEDFVSYYSKSEEKSNLNEHKENEIISEQETTCFKDDILDLHNKFMLDDKVKVNEITEIKNQDLIKIENNELNSNNLKNILPEKPVVLPQKKRFFSKSIKDKKSVQYNVKNFFNDGSNSFHVDGFDDNVNIDETTNKEQTKNIESDYNYLKLKKVKEAHKCAELGETEHFDGEINFYLSGIKDKNTNSMRCLSILGLASQCLNKPELRMHLRAHDYMVKIICALLDSSKNPNLALCAAALIFVYNQDRLTMDIDQNALSLMLELLECKIDTNENLIEKRHKEKITEMCKIMKEKGHGKYLKLSEISAGTLALETLLGLTSKRAGDWFKDELRKLNGIDYLLDTILKTSDSKEKEFMQQEGELNKIDRSLRVIENVTCMHKENQEYVIAYRECAFIKRCIKLFELCRYEIIYNENSSQSNHYLSPLLSILRVFSNLTSESNDGCIKIGQNIPNIFNIFLNSVFELPSFIVSDSRFDLIIFLLCLCLNLVEFCPEIRDNFIENQYQIKRLIVLLEERYEEAKKTEQQADEFLDSEETQRQLNAETINIDSILTDLVAKSGKHMEHTIIAACTSLLIGSGLKDNCDKMETIKEMLPGNTFEIMIDVITKLKEFSNLASIMTKSGIQRVETILSILKNGPPKEGKDDYSYSLMSIKEEDLLSDDD